MSDKELTSAPAEEPAIEDPSSIENGEARPPNETPSTRLGLSLEMTQGTRLRVTLEALPVGSEHHEASEDNQHRVGQTLDGADPLNVSLRLDPAEAIVLDLPALEGAATRPKRRLSLQRLAARMRSMAAAWPYSLNVTLFGLALGLYLLTRLVGLSNFPIYFFADEAVQTVLAIDLVNENFHNAEGELLPTYFYNVDKYSLSTTVYMQVLPYLLFGKSVFVTRITSVALTLLAAVCVSLILRDIFKLPYWWSGVLLLSIMPAWFYHSRTAFETVAMTSFYCSALYYYLLYRYRAPRYLYFALILFALAFYSYNPGRVVVVVTGVLLLLSDLRFHWDNRRTAALGLGLLVLLASPFLRFALSHPDAAEEQLSAMSSYWLQEIPLGEKLEFYRKEYLYGLSPGYWFAPNKRDLSRHLMKDYGHLLRPALPFAFLGLFQVLRHFRSPAHRAVLAAFLAAPTGAAVVAIAITRELVMVIPATLLIALGLIMLLTWLEGKKFPRTALSLALFVFLFIANLGMTWDALNNGPTWYHDYGLSGMQYGAAQVYSAVTDYLEEHPDAKIQVSPTWANGADVVARFFLHDPLPVHLASTSGYINHFTPLDDTMVFVMTVEEYQAALDSGKFAEITVEKILPYPDDRPGFYFTRLRYVDDIAEIMAAEKKLRSQLQEVEFVEGDQVVKARHSMLDLGHIADLWDGNQRTVARTFEANPFIIELTFPSPRRLNGLSLMIGDADIELLVHLYESGGDEPVEYIRQLNGSIDQQQVYINFDAVTTVKILHLEAKDLHQEEPAHVHIWEINLLEE